MRISNPLIREAINSLTYSHPDRAGILLQQKFVEDNGPDNPTGYVDGEVFAWNGPWLETLDFDQRKAFCAHEADHLLALDHIRIGGRELGPWNEAADQVNNNRLIKDGFKLPPGALCDPRFKNRSKEDVYSEMVRAKKDKKDGKQGQNPGQSQGSQSQTPGKPGNGQGNPDPNSQPDPGKTGGVRKAKGDLKAAEAKARMQVETALTVAKMAGALSADAELAIRKEGKPRYDWKEIVNRYVQEVSARDYSFARPNRRYSQSGFILPSLWSRDIGRIVIATDSSGSMLGVLPTVLAEVRSAVDTYLENGINVPVTVIYCDSKVCKVEELYSGDTPKPAGGGGTAFKPVFDYLKGDLGGAACLVYLTDGDTSDLNQLTNPGYPVIWGLICDSDTFKPGFGEVAKIDLFS